MDQTTVDMLSERRAQLMEKIVPLQAQVDQIDRCLFAIDALSTLPINGDAGTIQDGVMQALATEPNGLHVNDLLARMRRSRPSLTRESLAPQLSRLKRKGRVSSIGRAGWKLVAAGDETGEGER